MDEQWSFVGSKANQRWLWYDWSPHLKTVFAYAFGRHTDETLRQLLKHIKRLARKTICFSKLEEVHDKVIGEYINRQFFQPM